MADTVKKVEYRYLTVPDRAGEGGRVLAALRDAGVNLVAVHAFPSGGAAQFDLVAEDSAALEQAATQAGLQLSPKKSALLVQGDDRPGAVVALLEKLGNEGINVTALDAVVAGGGRFGGLIWVDQNDVDRAARVLG